MQVSVIIPVYNREKFVEKAVRSALAQPETGEVLFIDDGSTDNSLKIGYQLAKEDNRVKVFQHPKGKNLGPAAARNVGLRNAQFEFIAFLDSDDFYLENRFRYAKTIFQNHTNVDVVCDAVEVRSIKNGELLEIIQYQEKAKSKLSFETFIIAKNGYCSIVGVTIRKRIIERVDYIDERFRFAEDVDFLMRLCLTSNFYLGSVTEPIATIIEHDKRSIQNKDQIIPYRQLLYQEWFKKLRREKFPKAVSRHLFISFLQFHEWVQKSWSNTPIRLVKKGILMIYYLTRYPNLFLRLV